MAESRGWERLAGGSGAARLDLHLLRWTGSHGVAVAGRWEGSSMSNL